MIGPVLFVSGTAGASRRYRCTHHQEQLDLQGIKSSLREIDDVELLLDAISSPTIILQRVPFSPLIESLVKIAKASGHLLIFETDDLTFDPSLVDEVPFLDRMRPDEAEHFRVSIQGQFETLCHCDFLLTSTSPILAAGARLQRSGYVQPNAFSTAMAIASDQALEKRKALAQSNVEGRGDTVTLGYFSGTPTHDRDLASITPALVTTFQRFPLVKLQIVGPASLAPELRPFADRIIHKPIVPWEELPNLIAAVDINLAPLEMENVFCQAKSELKYLEAALVWVPTIASATPAFQHAIAPGETGLLAETVQDWQAHLTRLIENVELRHRLGNAAYDHVRRDYSPASRSKTLLTTLTQMRTEAENRRVQPPHGLSAVDAAELIRAHIHQMSVAAHDDLHRWHSLHKVSKHLMHLIGKRSGAAIQKLFRRN